MSYHHLFYRIKKDAGLMKIFLKRLKQRIDLWVIKFIQAIDHEIP
jgi:hypothetical protein